MKRISTLLLARFVLPLFTTEGGPLVVVYALDVTKEWARWQSGRRSQP